MSSGTSARARDVSTAATIRALNWRPREQNTLRAFVDLRLPSGLTLHDCTYHFRGEARWVGFPARPQLDRKGRVITTPRTGTPSYAAVVTIDDREARERFQRAALAAIDELLGSAP
jgi:hypothetical protein